MSFLKEKFTDQQLRIIQFITGVVSGAALIVALFVAGPRAGDSVILQYLWLVVFVIVMFGRRWVEKKYRLRLVFYNLVLIDTLSVCILIYLSILFFSPNPAYAGTYKEGYTAALRALTIIVPALGMLVLGVIMPLIKYNKRKEDGTLRPVRLPEPEEVDESDETPADNGPMTIEQQIEAMTNELDDDNTKDEN